MYTLKPLPAETWILIANHLDFNSLKSFALTNKHFHSLFTTIELQYKYWLEIYNQSDRITDTPDAIKQRLDKVQNLQGNFNCLNAQQHHVLIRDHKSALQARLDPNNIPYRKKHSHSSLRVLRDGYFLVSSRDSQFELYKLPQSNGESSQHSIDNVHPLYPSIVKFDTGGTQKQIQDFDLDVENDLIVCCIQEFQTDNTMLQFYFRFFSLSKALNEQEAVQHPIASAPFTHNILRASVAAPFQMQLNGPHLAVQFNERDGKSVVSVWNWTRQMALEAVYYDKLNLCEAAAFLTSDILALAIVLENTGNPIIQCVQLDSKQQKQAEQRYSYGLPDIPSGQVDAVGFKILSDFHLFDDLSGSKKHVPFVFAEPVVSHTTDASLRNRGSIQPTEESGCLCIEVASSDYLSDDIYPATFIIQKKEMLENMIERDVSQIDNTRRHGESRSKGSFDAYFLAHVTRVISEPKSVYPMYGTRFCNVPKINMIELIDFNPRLRQSKPPTLTADRKALVGGRQRRMDRYVQKHQRGTLIAPHTGDHEAMVNHIATRIRDFTANNDLPNHENALEGIEAIIDEENRRYLQHIDDNVDDEDEIDDDLDDEEIEDEDEDEVDEEEGALIGNGRTMSEPPPEDDGEEDEADDHEGEIGGQDEINVMQEIDMSDVSDEEERNMEHIPPGESVQRSLHETDGYPERQALVKGSQQSIDVLTNQAIYTQEDEDNEKREIEFKLPYRTILSFTDLGVESAMIDKECIVLEVGARYFIQIHTNTKLDMSRSFPYTNILIHTYNR
ncbi:hypothetical protein E3P92_02226 [Wallemia ichthyophaga]|uniref:F-box domain-containing protein n=1 Tax=Wallemia ichthyophaga TaxID=245174 RepID=A0A4T0F0H0_WALIC|nr:hypothetical protein E3P98_02897 [Wallemia ichthyophaga]TIB10553.1 hypothetical protein E3P90_02823 [Wallemia ichthyophaga]TIB10624.1 hypothetical protein E3P93_02831 [Wallemia ichthyophaga]TIB13678.1 hypothetical protein E3P92_02226 [Wallemia ichthyophaga]TIB21130.1 hypothetical protein E3P89_02807 [Wallemia ichthyophaga]